MKSKRTVVMSSTMLTRMKQGRIELDWEPEVDRQVLDDRTAAVLQVGEAAWALHLANLNQVESKAFRRAAADYRAALANMARVVTAS